ncbi:MAG: beta-lactamase family protein [Eubacterium sp.]|nr:beta-lactamase family protein [Eubacterium sp.]
MKDIFERTSPEEQGLSSQAIMNFISRMEKRDIDLHSIIILRNNRLIYEAYYDPYTADELHRMFSVTKSFVSAAIGCLWGEGKIDLDKPIADYFPEYSKKSSPITKAATIRHLLKMQSPHEKTAFKQIKTDNWTEAFFKAAPAKYPGTAFSYDTSATHTLTALVEKITGQKLLDYLRDKFLRESSFSEEAYCMTDPVGVSQGGSGLMAKPMDIAIFGNFILNGGKLGEKQVIPQEYIKEATKKQSETFIKGTFFEETKGYGYQFWLCENNGFMCYGIGGQLVLIYPEKKLVFVTTADTLGNKSGISEIMTAFTDTIFNELKDEPLKEDGDAAQRLKETTESLKISFLKPNPEISGESFKSKSFNIENNPYGFKALDVNIKDEKTGVIMLKKEGSCCFLPFGIGQNIEGKLPVYNCPCCSSAALTHKNELIILSSLRGEEPGKVYFQISLSGDSGTLLIRKTPLEGFGEFDRSYILKKIKKKKTDFIFDFL